MQLAQRRSILGFVVAGAIVAACSGATSPIDPPDAGPDAEGRPDTSTPDTSTPDATADAQQDAKGDVWVPDADTKDATLDASDPDATTDASDSGDAMSDASDASDAMADAGPPPPPLFMPGESGALYEMSAVCAIEHTNRVGAADNCCRDSTFTATTTCETMLREEPDGAGSLRVVVEPMQGCATLLTGEKCTRTGTVPRCDSNGLVCPANRTTGMGEPERLAGTYERRLMRMGTTTVPVAHYWIPGCPSGPTGLSAGGLPCTPRGDGYSRTGKILTTIARTGAGVFTVLRSWGYDESSCPGPYFDAPVSLGNTLFANGQGMGGTFSLDKYSCTYTLTKK